MCDAVKILVLLYLLVASSSNCPCGKPNTSRNSSNKIVGGNLAGAHSWPWMVALIRISGNKVTHFCGASIVNSKYILTAAHCTYDISEPLSNFRVFVGDNKINGTNVQKLKIQSITVHPEFNFQTLDFDISLIRLELPLTFSDTVRPICLETNNANLNGRTAIVSGWGAVRSGGPTVNAQREVKVDVVASPPCRLSYGVIGIQVTENMLCAASNKKDSCTGDSGGPLFLKRKNANIYDQIGVVSFGKGCAVRHFPGIYTRVSRLKNWIAANTLDGESC